MIEGMKRYGVPLYFYAHVEIDANNEDEAQEIAESLCVQITAKLDNYKTLDVYFEEVGEAVEMEEV